MYLHVDLLQGQNNLPAACRPTHHQSNGAHNSNKKEILQFNTRGPAPLHWAHYEEAKICKPFPARPVPTSTPCHSGDSAAVLDTQQFVRDHCSSPGYHHTVSTVQTRPPPPPPPTHRGGEHLQHPSKINETEVERTNAEHSLCLISLRLLLH